MDGQAYYESLLAQGYQSEEATKYTQQHYPGFAPTSPVMPASQPVVSPAPIDLGAPSQMIVEMPSSVVMQDSVISGDIQQSVTNINNFTTNIVGNQSTNTSKGMRITSGIFGMLMSLALIGYSLLILDVWAEASEDIKFELELLGLFADADDDVGNFYNSVDSFLDTISLFYYAILLVSISTFVISVLQFFNKPWGTKALLLSTGLLLLLCLVTGAYEVSSFNQIAEDYEKLTGDSLGKMPGFFEVSGTIGGYCAGLCLGVYALLGYIGRPKSHPVVMQNLG
jgi:hypothetical protein